MKQREQGAGPGGGEVVRDRMHDNQIERVLWQPRDLVRGNDADLRMAGKALFQSGAQARRRFAEEEFAGGRGHDIGVQRLARAGRLPAIRLGRYWRFRASSLDQWISVQSSGQPARVEKERRA